MMDGWMDGWIDDGWMDGWIDDGWMDRCWIQTLAEQQQCKLRASS